MSFAIQFLAIDDYLPEQRLYYLTRQIKLCLGKIIIGDFEETFEAPLAFWRKEDYQLHWRDALNRIIEGSDVSCLVATMHDPRSANFLTWWALYRYEDKVIVQNQLFFLKNAKGQFDPKNPYRFVKKHESVNEDGQEISQWLTSVNEIQEFFEDMQST